jgi:predicted nucleic acid-binding protein
VTLVVDANVVFAATARENGFDALGDPELIAPPLLWPEVRSALHVAKWRGLISEAVARRSLELLESSAVKERRHRRLGVEAWRIADQFGWSKSYDAEYLALASLLQAPLLTFDRRVRLAGERLGIAAALP